MKRFFGGGKPNGQSGIGNAASFESNTSQTSDQSGGSGLGVLGSGGGGQTKSKSSSGARASRSVLATDPKSGPSAEQKFLAELSMVMIEEEEEKRQKELKAQALTIAEMNNDVDRVGEIGDSTAIQPLQEQAMISLSKNDSSLIINAINGDKMSDLDEEERELQAKLKAQALALAGLDSEQSNHEERLKAETPGEASDTGDCGPLTAQYGEHRPQDGSWKSVSENSGNGKSPSTAKQQTASDCYEDTETPGSARNIENDTKSMSRSALDSPSRMSKNEEFDSVKIEGSRKQGENQVETAEISAIGNSQESEQDEAVPVLNVNSLNDMNEKKLIDEAVPADAILRTPAENSRNTGKNPEGFDVDSNSISVEIEEKNILNCQRDSKTLTVSFDNIADLFTSSSDEFGKVLDTGAQAGNGDNVQKIEEVPQTPDGDTVKERNQSNLALMELNAAESSDFTLNRKVNYTHTTDMGHSADATIDETPTESESKLGLGYEVKSDEMSHEGNEIVRVEGAKGGLHVRRPTTKGDNEWNSFQTGERKSVMLSSAETTSSIVDNDPTLRASSVEADMSAENKSQTETKFRVPQDSSDIQITQKCLEDNRSQFECSKLEATQKEEEQGLHEVRTPFDAETEDVIDDGNLEDTSNILAYETYAVGNDEPSGNNSHVEGEAAEHRSRPLGQLNAVLNVVPSPISEAPDLQEDTSVTKILESEQALGQTVTSSWEGLDPINMHSEASTVDSKFLQSDIQDILSSYDGQGARDEEELHKNLLNSRSSRKQTEQMLSSSEEIFAVTSSDLLHKIEIKQTQSVKPGEEAKANFAAPLIDDEGVKNDGLPFEYTEAWMSKDVSITVSATDEKKLSDANDEVGDSMENEDKGDRKYGSLLDEENDDVIVESAGVVSGTIDTGSGAPLEMNESAETEKPPPFVSKAAYARKAEGSEVLAVSESDMDEVLLPAAEGCDAERSCTAQIAGASSCSQSRSTSEHVEISSGEASESKNEATLVDEQRHAASNLQSPPGNGNQTSPAADLGSQNKELLHGFRGLKSSFRRLLSATASTATTFSEVTAPVLTEAGHVVASSASDFMEISTPAFSQVGSAVASSAAEVLDNCRRDFQRRRSDKNLIVEKSQNEKTDNASVDSAMFPVAQAISHDKVKPNVPSTVVLSSLSNIHQYRSDISRHLSEMSRSLPVPERVVDACSDPVLKAAAAGAAAARRTRRVKKQLEVYSPQNEWVSALDRLATYTASTAATVVANTAPALKEVRVVAAEFARTSVSRQEENDEETVVLSRPSSEALLSKRATSRQVFAADDVTFQSAPKRCHKKILQADSIACANPSQSSLASSCFPLECDVGTALPVKEKGTRRFVSCGSSSYNLRNQWNKRDALEHPQRIMDFLSGKFEGIETREHYGDRVRGRRNGNYFFDPNRSVFVHERKSASSSSLSSLDSPGVLSASSSSSSENGSHFDVISRTSSAAGIRFNVTDSAVVFWDMIIENQTSALSPTADTVMTNGTKIESAGSAMTKAEMVAPRSARDLKVETSVEADMDKTGECKQTPTRMETHVEHPHESENVGLDSSMDATTPTTKNYSRTAIPDQSVEIADETEHTVGTIQDLDLGESLHVNEMKTPPVGKSFDSLDLASFSMHSNGSTSTPAQRNLAPTKRASVAKRRQKQADKRTELFIGVKSAKSGKQNGGDNQMLAGNLSIPGKENETGELLHADCKRSLPSSSINSPQGSVNWATNSSLAGSKSTFSGSKRGSSYSAKNRTSRRRSVLSKNGSFRLEDAVNLLPKSTQFQLSGLQRSPSGNDLLLLPGNESETSIEFRKGHEPDFDEISAVEEGAGMLDLALVTFSSVANANSDLLNSGLTCDIPRPLKYLASVRWRQLLSNWRHTMFVKALTEKACSFHYVKDDEGGEMSDDEDTSMSSFCVKRSKRKRMSLSLSLPPDESLIHSETKNLNGLLPHLADGEVSTLTNFLAEFGYQYLPQLGKKIGRDKSLMLAHILPETVEVATTCTLVDLAVSYMEEFASFIEDIVSFASQNHATTSDIHEPEVLYSVGIKSYEAIEKKAERKYGSDLLQVKDILRAQITFGDEGSFVAGLLHLKRLCQRARERDKDDFSVEIVRVKNLFRKGPSGELLPSLLPTGYRHILVNLRLKNSMLAEIQFQLADVFEILGFEGYELHQEILEIKEACEQSYYNTSNNEKHCSNIDPGDTLKSKSKTESVQARGNTEIRETKTETDEAKNTPSEVESDGCGDIVSVSRSKEEAGISEEITANKSESRAVTIPSNGEFQHCEEYPPKNPSETVDTAESDHDSDSFHPFNNTAIKRQNHIEDLRSNAKDYSRQEVLEAIRTCAIDSAASRTRDVPTYFCLHLLSMFETERGLKRKETNLKLLGIMEDQNVWPLFCPKESKKLAPSALGFDSAHKDKTCVRGTGSLEDNLVLSADENDNVEKDLLISRECLLRCLAISNQGTSVGMTGWLEYGADNSFGRMANLPFEALHQLACNMARANNWDGTFDVLTALLTRCEQHLPLYHPITLSAMLDLAGVARKISKTALEVKLRAKVSSRLAFYLAEQEQTFFCNLDRSSRDSKSNTVAVLRFDNGIDGIAMLKSYTEIFEDQLRRDFLQILCGIDEGSYDDIRFIKQCFLGDALSVLANCISASEALFGTASRGPKSRYYWHAAYKRYEAAFKGWIAKKHGLGDDNVFSSIYGMARCLRELKQRQKAEKLLSSTVAALEKANAQPSREDESSSAYGKNHVPVSEVANDQQFNRAIYFLPFRPAKSRGRILFMKRNIQPGGKGEQSLALLLWHMAVIAVEENPNERGRIRALSLLHAASEALQTVVSPQENGIEHEERANSKNEDGRERLSYRRDCYEILRRIEQEAEDLLEPWENVSVPPSHRNDDIKTASRNKKLEEQQMYWLYHDCPSASV